MQLEKKSREMGGGKKEYKRGIWGAENKKRETETETDDEEKSKRKKSQSEIGEKDFSFRYIRGKEKKQSGFHGVRRKPGHYCSQLARGVFILELALMDGGRKRMN